MGQKELSVLLKAVVAILAVFLACVTVLFVPVLGRSVYAFYEYTNPTAAVVLGVVIPVSVAVSTVPGFAALYLAWQIFTQIGKNNSFCLENARRLGTISRLALGDTVFYAVMFVAVFAIGTKHPSVPLIFMAIIIFGAAMTVVCAALSHLTRKAAELKSDNDLTI